MKHGPLILRLKFNDLFFARMVRKASNELKQHWKETYGRQAMPDNASFSTAPVEYVYGEIQAKPLENRK